MKKLTALILALIMTLALGITALADEPVEEPAAPAALDEPEAIADDVTDAPGDVAPAPEEVPAPVPTGVDGWSWQNGHWYWFEKGAAKTGWVKTGGKWYYMDPKTAQMVTGTFMDTDGYCYHCDGDGVMCTGWILLPDGDYLYANGSGVLQRGWVKSGGKWYYMDSETFRMATGLFIAENGEHYYANGSGAMLTGWISLGGGDYYYAKGSGELQTGWVKSGKTWYYMDPETMLMVKDVTLTIGGSQYMFTASGAMRTGWISLGGGDYLYADGSGTIQHSMWVKTGGKWYYLHEDGRMARSEFINGDYVGSDGAWVYGPGGSSGGSGSVSNSRTVYVSRNGKIHLRSNCSGMKYYSTMTYGQAVSRGYKKCDKCF